MTQRTCVVPNCSRRMCAVKMCATHYRNLRLYGRLEGCPDPVCTTCGESFKRPGKSGVLPRFCSRDCDPSRRLLIVPCKFCGVMFDRKKTSRVHCSEVCMNRWRLSGGPADFIGRRCYICDTELDFNTVGPGGRVARANVRRCGDCRRRTNYAVTVEDLLERDGDECRLCGESVTFEHVWPHGLSATRDHIVPHSLGGSDDLENMQLAHFVCNVRKGNRSSV